MLIRLRIGYVDGQGRAYRTDFRSYLFRLLDSDGAINLTEGEKIIMEVQLASVILLPEENSKLMLSQVRGSVMKSNERLVFLALENLSRSHSRLSYLNIPPSGIPATAVEQFFLEKGGREFWEIDVSEAVRKSRIGDRVVLDVRSDVQDLPHGPNYEIELYPLEEAERLLEDFGFVAATDTKR